MSTVQLHWASCCVGPTGNYVTVGTRHCGRVGDGVGTRRPGQRSRIGATLDSGSEINWGTRSWKKGDKGTKRNRIINIVSFCQIIVLLLYPDINLSRFEWARWGCWCSQSPSQRPWDWTTRHTAARWSHGTSALWCSWHWLHCLHGSEGCSWHHFQDSGSSSLWCHCSCNWSLRSRWWEDRWLRAREEPRETRLENSVKETHN